MVLMDQRISKIMSNKKTTYVVVAVVILVVLAILFLISPGQGSNPLLAKYDNVQVNGTIANEMHIPDSIFASVGIGSAGNMPQPVKSRVNLTYGGKPEVLYIGSEFCPFCAAERWAMIIALDRFGNFTGLQYMTSSPTDYLAGTPTFTFANSTYESQYISFVSVELNRNMQVNGTYPLLQRMTPAESSVAAAYNPGGGIPFIDFANRSVMAGATYSPKVLQGYDWVGIIQQIYMPNTTISQGIVGSANMITAEICKMDGNRPASVCGKNYIKNIETFA